MYLMTVCIDIRQQPMSTRSMKEQNTPVPNQNITNSHTCADIPQIWTILTHKPSNFAEFGRLFWDFRNQGQIVTVLPTSAISVGKREKYRIWHVLIIILHFSEISELINYLWVSGSTSAAFGNVHIGVHINIKPFFCCNW